MPFVANFAVVSRKKGLYNKKKCKFYANEYLTYTVQYMCMEKYPKYVYGYMRI